MKYDQALAAGLPLPTLPRPGLSSPDVDPRRGQLLLEAQPLFWPELAALDALGELVDRVAGGASASAAGRASLSGSLAAVGSSCLAARQGARRDLLGGVGMRRDVGAVSGL